MKLLSKGDSELLFAYRRKVYKELSYDERSKPATRKRLKQLKIKQQSGKCMECQAPLPFNNAVLDRFVAAVGYVSENTRLICPGCDQKIQRERAFK